jgi:outer membrane protein
MKKLMILTALVLMGFISGYGQKYAYVDTDYILNNIPEYTDAQALLNDLSAQWQKEIEAKFQEIDKLYKDYQAESILLPEDLKKQRENEIIQKEKEAKDLQKKRFGKEGDLYKKRIELVEPIQEKIFTAIQDMAITRNYAFIFDKAGGSSLLFADAKYDLSDDILDEIGTVMQTVRRENRTRETTEISKSQGTSTSGQAMPAQGMPQSRTGTGTGTQQGGTQMQQGGVQQQGTDRTTPPPPGEKKK